MTPDSAVLVWAIVVLGGVITFAFRGSFVLAADRLGGLPPVLEWALGYVPAAVLAALIGPALLVQEGTVVINPFDRRLIAGAVGLLIAWETEDIFWTIVGGMIVFWLLGAVP